MVALRYFPAAESENNGLTEHEDSNCISLVFQDEAGGLEVRKDGEWIPVIPAKGTLVVNMSDVIQVIQHHLFFFVIPTSSSHTIKSIHGPNHAPTQAHLKNFLMLKKWLNY